MFRAVAYKELNQFEEAIATLDQSVSVDPTNAKVYSYRGDIKDDLKRYRDAIADFDKAIALEPQYANAYNYRGIAYDELGRHHKAIADYNKANKALSIVAVKKCLRTNHAIADIVRRLK